MFQDVLAASMRISVAPNQMVQASFALVGTDGAALTTSTGGETAVAASVNQPFDSFNGSIFDNIAETGNEIANITAMEFTVENSINPSFVVGQQTPLNLEYGRGRVTGQLTAHFEDGIHINRFLSESETPIILNITDPSANAMEFRMERTKFTDADRPVQNENARLITLPFVALLDASIGSALQISIT